MEELLSWDIYEITPKSSLMRGVGVRGRLRKFGLIHSINIIAENTEDVEGKVRFAVLNGTDVKEIVNYLSEIFPDAEVKLIKRNLKNPVLSKMKVNIEERYDLIKGIIDK